MPALAFVVRDAVARIKFQPACNKHMQGKVIELVDYSVQAALARYV